MLSPYSIRSTKYMHSKDRHILIMFRKLKNGLISEIWHLQHTLLWTVDQISSILQFLWKAAQQSLRVLPVIVTGFSALDIIATMVISLKLKVNAMHIYAKHIRKDMLITFVWYEVRLWELSKAVKTTLWMIKCLKKIHLYLVGDSNSKMYTSNTCRTEHNTNYTPY